MTMVANQVTDIVHNQRAFFYTHATKPLAFRVEQLKKLKRAIQANEEKLYQAIFSDFGKSKFDTYTTELSLIYSDIDYFVKNIKSLAAPERASTNLVNQMGTSRIHREPLGVSLVIGAWNYPYQLSLTPAIAAMAAGNTVVLKPSEIAAHTSAAMADVVNSTFDQTYFHVIEGGIEITTEILAQKFDKIFFTGSPRVGKIIYQAAAKHMTPVTLELGGKSPALVSNQANIQVAAKRIVWGKFLNAGQTCVAPDYVLVHHSVKETLVSAIKDILSAYKYNAGSEHYTQIINERNFDRLAAMIDEDRIVYGGHRDRAKRYIEPTILDPITWDHDIMQEEIFGPILPILTYESFDDAIAQIHRGEKPLAAYLFTNSKAEKKTFTSLLSFGGGCINDVVMHLSNDSIPFGGVGNSGIGNYHGKYGFDAFSHIKSVLDRATWGEPNLKYPPYSEKKLSWIKRLMG